MATILELGQKVKAKYPEYQDMDDLEVGRKVKAKYPTEYADFTEVSETPKKSGMEKTGGVLDTLFGGGKVGEAIGTSNVKGKVISGEIGEDFDYSKLSPQAIERLKSKGVPTTAEAQRQEIAHTIETPTKTQLLGDVGRVALNFAPIGTASKALGIGGKALGLGKLAKPIANITTGAGVGYGADVTTKLSEGVENPLSPSIGTGVGAGLASVPYVGKGLARLGSEALGLSTGTGAGTIRQFTSSIAKGGESAQVAREALRGNLNPEDIVQEAKTAFGQIIKNRSTDYTTELAKLKTKTNNIDHTPVIGKFNKLLEDFGVFVNTDGTPNFSRAPGLGRYEKDLKALSKTLSEWGTQEGDNTIVGVDKLKQVINDFRIGSQDSKKFDTFITALGKESKDIIKNDLIKSKDLKTLTDYQTMLGNYEKSTKEIREIQRALSLGDKASIDTAFRKLSTVLRTNNEMRKLAIDQLDEITEGKLLPKIAGQQLSEKLPRGLVRQLGGVGLATGALSGVSLLPMMKLALFTSPRIVGELLNVLGIVGNKANLVKEALIKGGVGAPGDYFFGGNSSNATKLQQQTTKPIAKETKLGLNSIPPKEAKKIRTKKISLKDIA